MALEFKDIPDQEVREWYKKNFNINKEFCSTPQKISICIHCIHNPQYLQMACLCILSLRKEGVTTPIVLMIDKSMYNQKELNLLLSLGVTIFCTNCTIRQWCYEMVFRKFPNIESLINIDCDQFLHNYSLDFQNYDTSEYDLQLFEKNNWENETAFDVLETRESLFFNSPYDLESLFQMKLSSYKEWCKTRQWIWGNFIIINRRILESQFWKITKRMGFIYPDDEGAYMVALFLSKDIKFRYLDNIIDQFIGSLTAVDDIPDLSALIHYPGPPWKKESKQIFNKLWSLYFGNEITPNIID